jgi:hypothetical protein
VTWFLDLRAQSFGGGVARDVAVYDQDTPNQLAALQAAIRNHDVLFVTHGFNVNRDDGRRSLGFWESWQSLPDSAVYVAVLWPGDSAWIPAIDYPIEGNEAISSGNLLADFILANLLGAASFSFASHSLGARVVLQTIRGIKATTKTRRLIMMAGAIDDTCLEDEYADAAQAVEKISVLSSWNDDVLEFAFPLGNFAAGLVTRDSPYWHAALGRDGPQSTLGGKVQTGWQIPDPWDYGHGNYLPQSPPMMPPLPVPQAVPRLNTPVPAVLAAINEWRAAWSAAILSTRFP